MIREDEHGNRDVVLGLPDQEPEGHLRVFQTPGYEPPDPHYWPDRFHLLWWLPKGQEVYLEHDGEYIPFRDIGAEIDRATLTELRDEIDRVLREEER